MPFVLAYHRVDDEGGGLGVSPEEFRAQLAWLSSEGYEVVDLDAPRYHPRDEKPSVAFTFDDGYRSVAEVAWPELRSRAWPAMLYVVTRTLENLDRFAWDAAAPAPSASLIDRGLLLELAWDGMSIGSHPRTHAYLSHRRSHQGPCPGTLEHPFVPKAAWPPITWSPPKDHEQPLRREPILGPRSYPSDRNGPGKSCVTKRYI